MDFIDEITITDRDIDWVEGILDGDIRFDQSRRNIIKSLESIDIQAFPGSGKTTILVAKLAILAKNGHLILQEFVFFLIQMWQEKKLRKD